MKGDFEDGLTTPAWEPAILLDSGENIVKFWEAKRESFRPLRGVTGAPITHHLKVNGILVLTNRRLVFAEMAGAINTPWQTTVSVRLADVWRIYGHDSHDAVNVTVEDSASGRTFDVEKTQVADYETLRTTIMNAADRVIQEELRFRLAER